MITCRGSALSDHCLAVVIRPFSHITPSPTRAYGVAEDPPLPQPLPMWSPTVMGIGSPGTVVRSPSATRGLGHRGTWRACGQTGDGTVRAGYRPGRAAPGGEQIMPGCPERSGPTA